MGCITRGCNKEHWLEFRLATIHRPRFQKGKGKDDLIMPQRYIGLGRQKWHAYYSLHQDFFYLNHFNYTCLSLSKIPAFSIQQFGTIYIYIFFSNVQLNILYKHQWKVNMHVNISFLILLVVKFYLYKSLIC